MSEIDQLRMFARKVLSGYFGGGVVGDIDGGTLQDYAAECGLLKVVTATESCGEHCSCADFDCFPLDCYRPTSVLTGKATP